MFFRFGSAIVLVVLISLTGVALEKENLELKRAVSRQQFQLDVLRNEHAQMRLRTQQLGAPVRIVEALEQGRMPVRKVERPASNSPRQMPLLRWQKTLDEP
ncbi:MAG: hypothetical protein IT428_11755 [Planctomycetaceae bacterium]|jgi:hypothetical protein|nr:hypothetical protein [Planctomycetaceae bacterium]